jgi:uridine kinase
MDNYYKKRDDLSFEERKKIKYDHPEGIHMELLKRHIRELMDSRNIDGPVYNFAQHNREESKTIKINPAKVIMIECILA